ncbi:MAG: hypothetical protein LBO74_03325 [Candidatus Symbiothrix sp.]|jgi:hypothetical protein|nr:hypothetical protein [Candidatus Symbiothrix sp.]
MKHLRQLFELMIVLLIPVSSYAQEDMKGLFPTPNVASLGVFGQIPVSLYTGVPQIDIPLYTLEENGITIPIALTVIYLIMNMVE